MLQRSFFITETAPYKENPVLSLSGGQAFEEDTIFAPGQYAIEIQAGDGYSTHDQSYIRCPAKITKNIVVKSPFIVRAYCGGSATGSSPGTNPYSGAFKVNAYMTAGAVPSVSHIFGNSGSASFGNANAMPTSGNCLGNGGSITSPGTGYHSGAGSCLHLLPIGGTFGTDYLFAFHVTAAPVRGAGSGSAYGGAGSGVGSTFNILGGTGHTSSSAAGSTPYGNGGAGVGAPSSSSVTPGKDGTGIGYGAGGGSSVDGAGAWFDGTNWNDSRTVGVKGSGGRIVITYIGAIN